MMTFVLCTCILRAAFSFRISNWTFTECSLPSPFSNRGSQGQRRRLHETVFWRVFQVQRWGQGSERQRVDSLLQGKTPEVIFVLPAYILWTIHFGLTVDKYTICWIRKGHISSDVDVKLCNIYMCMCLCTKRWWGKQGRHENKRCLRRGKKEGREGEQVM